MEYRELEDLRIDPMQLLKSMTQEMWRTVKYRNPRFEYEDLEQEGSLGFMDGLEKADTSQIDVLENYLKLKIKSAQLDFIRRNRIFTRDEMERMVKDPSNPKNELVRERREVSCEDDRLEEVTPEDIYKLKQIRELIAYHSLRILSPIERKVLNHYLADKTSSKAIQKEEGLSESRVSQIKARAIRKLQEAINI